MQTTCFRRGMAVLLGALVTLVPACHTHRLVQSGVPEAGSSVQVRLADSTARARAGWEAVTRNELSGRVVRADRDSLVLSVPSRVGDGPAHPSYRDTLPVPSSLVLSVREERLSPWRSAVLTAGLVAGTFALLQLDVFRGGGSVGPPNGDGMEHRGRRPKRPPP